MLRSPPRAHAQYIGGTPPAGTSFLSFTTTGVASAAGFSTFFTCTNPYGFNINIAVQVFDQNGSAMNASPALSVPPGGTTQFATGNAAPFVPDQILSPVNSFTKGAAKIWSDQKNIHCEAFLACTAGLHDLRLIAQGKKQRGD